MDRYKLCPFSEYYLVPPSIFCGHNHIRIKGWEFRIYGYKEL